jgi:hypothetical protein
MSEPVGEFQRRHSHTNTVLDYFRAHPGQWVDMRTLERLGGRNAWRTRVSNARKVFCAELGWDFPIQDGPDPIRNRQQRILTYNEATGHLTQVEQVISEYMYWPHRPLGPDAGEPRERLLFDTHPRG